MTVEKIASLMEELESTDKNSNKSLDLAKEIKTTTNEIILDEEGELCITKDLLDEFKKFNIDLSMYGEYGNMVIYVKYNNIGVEVTRVLKKDLIV